MGDSKVQMYVEGMRMLRENSPDTEPRRVTVRLDPLKYGALLLIAGEIEDSPTGCAQELLSYAIEDGLQALGYKSFEEAIPDIKRLSEANEEFQAKFEADTSNIAALAKKGREVSR